MKASTFGSGNFLHCSQFNETDNSHQLKA